MSLWGSHQALMPQSHWKGGLAMVSLNPNFLTGLLPVYELILLIGQVPDHFEVNIISSLAPKHTSAFSADCQEVKLID